VLTIPEASNFSCVPLGFEGVIVKPATLVVEVRKFSPVVVELLLPFVCGVKDVAARSTYAVVAGLVELSLAACVVAVVPFGRAGVPVTFDAVGALNAAGTLKFAAESALASKIAVAEPVTVVVPFVVH